MLQIEKKFYISHEIVFNNSNIKSEDYVYAILLFYFDGIQFKLYKKKKKKYTTNIT